MSSGVMTSGTLIGSGTGVIAATTSDCEKLSGISGVTGVGGGAGVGDDPQKERFRVVPSPTITLDRGFRGWA